LPEAPQLGGLRVEVNAEAAALRGIVGTTKATQRARQFLGIGFRTWCVWATPSNVIRQ